MSNKICYENTNYMIEVDSDNPNGEGDYVVVNKKYEVDEGRFHELPSAMSFAEQMDRILIHGLWKSYAEQLTPIEEDVEVGNQKSMQIPPFQH